MSSWDDVGGDPVPGDLGALQGYVNQLQAVADHGRELEQQLRALHSGMGEIRWTGAGAAGVSSVIEKNFPPLIAFWCAHRDAATSLARYASEAEAWRVQAQAQLAAYSSAANDLAAAQARVGPATSSQWSADAQIVELNAALKVLEAQRATTSALGHPTAHIDWQIHETANALMAEHRARSTAENELADAQRCVDDAQGREHAARAAIDQIRDEVNRSANQTRIEILGLVGIVPTHNWLVRGVDDVMSGYQKTQVLRESFVDAWTTTAGWVNDVALATSWIPVWNVVINGAAQAMNVPMAIGYTIELCSGNHKAATIEGLIGSIPFGAALARNVERGIRVRNAAGFVERTGQDLLKPDEFNSILGNLKRARWYDDAREATGLIRGVEVAPRLVGNSIMNRSLLVAKSVQDGYDRFDETRRAVHYANVVWDAAGRTPAGRAVESSLESMPVDTLPSIRTVRIHLPRPVPLP
ncbi:hypothetical protein [uncultured Jatrophihabitans sp.]|uniref:hypothetical protein n=1 Tax=uncultured Jatrophihabitans sp. TaxID=1610747 RepID=UPI0035CB9D08